MSASPSLRRRLVALAILVLQPSIAVAPLSAGGTVATAGQGRHGGLPLPAGELAAHPRDPDEYLVVDCLLPGKVRRLGRRVTYLSPRRPLRTTALDCGIRGGEYTSYDRADYRTALAVWQEQAESGEAEAQYMVAQIYEKGLGTAPDYTRAAGWYRQAAEQSHNAAQISLGYLLERGLGVTADPAAALSWYRRAAGLPADVVVLATAEAPEREQDESRSQAQLQEIAELRQRAEEAEARAQEAASAAAAAATSSAADRAADKQEHQRLQALAEALRRELDARTADIGERERLEVKLREQEQEMAILLQRAEAAEQVAREATSAAAATATAAAADKQERLRLQAQAEALRQELAAKTTAAANTRAALEQTAAAAAPRSGGSPGTSPAPAAASASSTPTLFPGLDFGHYHALVIGNGAYATLPDLPAARESARDFARLLEARYGFRVTLLLDADRAAILSALNALREQLAKQDNLLVFYAGHSVRDPAGDRGWWQPVDADAESRVRWIPTQVLADHLELMPVRHALLVADAHFPGVLTRSSIPHLAPGLSPEKKRQALEALLQKRSRLVLTPGEGVESPGASSFSAGLLEILGKGTGVLEASSLYQQLNDRLLSRPQGQAPEFAPMRWAAHEGGADFLLVAKTPGN